MSSTQPIRVVLADDHRSVHEAVTAVLSTVADIALVGHGNNGHEALHLCAELRPDLILMDVVMRGMNGIEATRLIREKYPEIKVLVLSSFQDDDSAREMLKNGAVGYVLKGTLSGDLIDTIRTVSSGKAVFSTEIAQALLDQPTNKPGQTFGLTRRELEILKLMAEGQNNGEIAQLLVISQSTVKFHIANILHKVGVETRAEAIVAAAQNMLL